MLKRFLYSQLALRQAAMILLGKEQPLVPFTVEADPPSVYLVFRLRSEVVDGLGAALGIPDHLRPMPIRCLDGDEPAHLLTLNIYRVSGLANGLRAEWSIYVDDGGGRPRYLIIDARSSQVSMDPVDIITRATPVIHERRGATVHSRVGADPEAFDCSLDVSPGDETPLVVASPEWATANDYIYWINGVCDRTFYDAGMVAPRVRRVPQSAVTLEDNTRWAALIEPEPVHVLVFEDAIELVISPWENIDRLGR